MIVEHLSRADRLAALHPRFAQAFAFLRRADLATIPDGRHVIDGDHLFAIIARGPARGRDKSPLEFHQRYIDIQYVVSGSDTIGWQPVEACRNLSTPYESDREVGFYADAPDTWLSVPAGFFAILYPEDPHAPLAGTEAAHKVVIKVELAR